MAEPMPREITQRELRNDSGAIMRGVERGESYTITRNGTPIARLILSKYYGVQQKIVKGSDKSN